MVIRLRDITKKHFTGMAGCIALAGSILMANITQAVSGDTEILVIERVYETPSAAAPLFSEQFLQAVPIGQIVGAVDALRASYGSAQAIREAGGGYEIETPTHRIPVQISLDAGRTYSLVKRFKRLLCMFLGQRLEVRLHILKSVSLD